MAEYVYNLSPYVPSVMNLYFMVIMAHIETVKIEAKIVTIH